MLNDEVLIIILETLQTRMKKAYTQVYLVRSALVTTSLSRKLCKCFENL